MIVSTALSFEERRLAFLSEAELGRIADDGNAILLGDATTLEDEEYFGRRCRQALVMFYAASDPAIRAIHSQLARQYAVLSTGENSLRVTTLDPSSVVTLTQIAKRVCL